MKLSESEAEYNERKKIYVQQKSEAMTNVFNSILKFSKETELLKRYSKFKPLRKKFKKRIFIRGIQSVALVAGAAAQCMLIASQPFYKKPLQSGGISFSSPTEAKLNKEERLYTTS